MISHNIARYRDPSLGPTPTFCCLSTTNGHGARNNASIPVHNPADGSVIDSKDGKVVSGVMLCWTDAANAAVAMVKVVPADEGQGPGARRIEVVLP